MSTIVTRKSLALGAIVALATTAFAGTPAQAAGEIVVAPSAGTSYSTLITDAFVLETSFAPGVTNANTQLKYQLKTSKALSFDATEARSASAAVAASTTLVTATGDASDAAAYVAYVSGTASAIQRNFLGFKLNGITYTSDSTDVVVTAFVDANNDGKLTSGEWATAKTVSFKKYADVTSTLELDAPKTGDNTLTGYVTLAGLNQDQIQSAVKLQFRKTATTSLDGLDANVGANGAFGGVTASATTAGNYKATTASVDTLDSTDTVELTAVVGSSSVSVGTKVVKTTSARTISEIKATVDASDNGLTTNVARTNKEFSVTALVKDTATTPVAAAGVALTVKVGTTLTGTWSTTAGSEQTVTVNGTKYSTYAALAAASVAATTDAAGKASVKISTTGFTSADALDVTFSAQNLSVKVDVDLVDAVYEVKDAANAPYRKIAKNSSATIDYTVTDQFKVLASATNLRLQITSVLGTVYVPVTAGKASVVITPTKDTTDAAGVDVAVSQTLQASTTATNGNVTWSDYGTQLSVARNIVVSAVADKFDTAPVLATVNGSAWTSTSTDKQKLATGDATDLTPNSATITGSVLTRGAELTVSGAGLRFVYDGVAYSDKFTLPISESSGDFNIKVASLKAGAQVVTLTTGAESKTVSITFATAVVSQLKNTVVTAPSAAQAGRAVTVAATLTDANGNAVAGKLVKFAVAGVGSLSSSDAVTDASGVATVRLVSSYGEDGDSVVTVSHNGSDDATDGAGTDFTLAKTITFGITDAQIDNVGKRVTAVASFSKGKTVAFYVNGVKKWSKLSASDADVVLNYNLKKGRNTVTMKISGGFITSEVIIVK
jgi:adhesin/invasin